MSEVCNRDCFNCKFEDCINDSLTVEELTKKDEIKEEVSREVQLKRDCWNRYAQKNREKISRYSKEYYYKNREKILERSKQWQKDNPLRVNAQKRELYHKDIELSRQKQRDRRAKIRESLPHCNDCEECLLVQKDKGEGYRRLCVRDLRLIEQKGTTSPFWCSKRKENKRENSKK